jgi:TfoX/Sxy family transcriptional regulator of competence genes
MPYDRDLAERIRALVDGEAATAEQAMFGGLAFLVGGNLAVAASGQGGLLVRVDPAESDALVALPGVQLMEMGGRSMRGWLRVEDAQLRTPDALERWVERGMSFARSLPAKG